MAAMMYCVTTMHFSMTEMKRSFGMVAVIRPFVYDK